MTTLPHTVTSCVGSGFCTHLSSGLHGRIGADRDQRLPAVLHVHVHAMCIHAFLFQSSTENLQLPSLIQARTYDWWTAAAVTSVTCTTQRLRALVFQCDQGT